MNARTALLLALVQASGLFGCAQRNGPYEPTSEAARDPRSADALNAEAAAIMHSQPEKAERLLRRALSADLYHGPAHNNLGVVYLHQGKLYEAAGEFEWARQLMPGHPDPRLNLGITLERAGRVEDALAAHTAALSVSPEHVPTMQALARLQVRSGRVDERTPQLLSQVAMRGESSEWREWAQRTLLRLGD